MTPHRILFAVIALAALAGIVGALFLVDTSDEDDAPDVAGGDLPVEERIPAPEAEILRQEPVGIDLSPGWTGALSVNGTPIPPDELLPGREPLGQLLYTAGEGKAVERFEAGRNCVAAEVWRFEESRENSQTIRWCFNVT